MNRTSIVLFLLLLVRMPSGFAQTVTSSQLEQREGTWYLKATNTPFTGAVNDPGELAGAIVDGKREGRWTAWQENGEPSWIDYYEQGNRTYHAMYFPTGSMRVELHYKEGQLDGVLKQWYASGTLQAQTDYANGQRHGTRTLWDIDGKLLYEASYTRGTLHGTATWWYNNGRKRWETFYESGDRSGVWTQWGQDGRILRQSSW